MKRGVEQHDALEHEAVSLSCEQLTPCLDLRPLEASFQNHTPIPPYHLGSTNLYTTPGSTPINSDESLMRATNTTHSDLWPLERTARITPPHTAIHTVTYRVDSTGVCTRRTRARGADTRLKHSCSHPPAPPFSQTSRFSRFSGLCAVAAARVCTCTSAVESTPRSNAAAPPSASASRRRAGSTAGQRITECVA